MNYSYNESLPSYRPFMWVDKEETVGDYKVLSFGAYNAYGLIGPELAGVAIVNTKKKNIVAVKTIPYNPEKRIQVFDALNRGTTAGLIESAKASGFIFRYDPDKKPMKKPSFPRIMKLLTEQVQTRTDRSMRDESHQDVKVRIAALAKWFFSDVAKKLGLKKKDYDLRFNPGGCAVMGEITLHTDAFYAQVSAGSYCSPFWWRTCKGRKDFTGGRNQDARSAEDLFEQIKNCQLLKENKNVNE